ncbi:MAG: hypothetical protein QOE30_1951 [Mycobacterium sp.]|nr:hypothetical protein [Mycobacterium sp.]
MHEDDSLAWGVLTEVDHRNRSHEARIAEANRRSKERPTGTHR